MKKFQTISKKLASFLPAFALLAGILTANQACFTYFHEPEMPDEMNAYRK